MRNNVRAQLILEDNIPELEGRMKRFLSELDQELSRTGNVGPTRSLNKSLEESNKLLTEVRQKISNYTAVLAANPGTDLVSSKEIARLTRQANLFEQLINKISVSQQKIKKAGKEVDQTINDALGKGTISTGAKLDNLAKSLDRIQNGFKLNLSQKLQINPGELEAVRVAAEKQARAIKGILTKVDRGYLSRGPQDIVELKRNLDEAVRIQEAAAHKIAEFQIAELNRVEAVKRKNKQDAERVQREQIKTDRKTAANYNENYAVSRRQEFMSLLDQVEQNQRAGTSLPSSEYARNSRDQLNFLRRYLRQDPHAAAQIGMDPAIMDSRLKSATYFLRDQEKVLDPEFQAREQAKQSRDRRKAEQDQMNAVNRTYAANRHSDFVALQQRIKDAQVGNYKFKSLGEVETALDELKALHSYLPKDAALSAKLGFQDPVNRRLDMLAQSRFLMDQKKSLEEYEKMNPFQKVSAFLTGKSPSSLNMSETAHEFNHRVTNISQLMGYSLYGMGAFGAASGLIKASVNQSMQADQMQSILAGFLNTYLKFKGDNGQAVNPSENYLRSVQRSKELYGAIRETSQKSILTTEQLSQYYLTGAGFGLKAGLSPEQVLRFVDRIGTIGKTMHLRETETISDIRNILGGRITANTRTAMLLGITKNDRDQAMAKGPDAFMNMFEEKMKGLNPALDDRANSFTNKLSAFVKKLEMVGQTIGDALIPHLSPMIDSLRSTVDQWVSSGNAEKFAKSLGSILSTTGNTLVTLVDFLSKNVNSPLNVAVTGFVGIMTLLVASVTKAAIAANPEVAVIAAALAALGTLFMFIQNQTESMKQSAEKYEGDIDKYKKSKADTSISHKLDQDNLANTTVRSKVKDAASLASLLKTSEVKEGELDISDLSSDVEKGYVDLTSKINVLRKSANLNPITVEQTKSKLQGVSLGVDSNTSWWNDILAHGKQLDALADLTDGINEAEQDPAIYDPYLLSRDSLWEKIIKLNDAKGTVSAATNREIVQGGAALDKKVNALLTAALYEAKLSNPKFNLSNAQAKYLLRMHQKGITLSKSDQEQYNIIDQSIKKIVNRPDYIMNKDANLEDEKGGGPSQLAPSYTYKEVTVDNTALKRRLAILQNNAEDVQYRFDKMSEDSIPLITEKARFMPKVLQSKLAVINQEYQLALKSIPTREQYVGSTRQNWSDATQAVDMANPSEIEEWAQQCPPGTDCSSFIQYMAAKMGKRVSRTAIQQYKGTTRILSKGQTDFSKLAPGDLVFFDNGRRDSYNTYGKATDGGYVNHVGMYLGNGKFIDDPGNGTNVRKVKDLSTYLSRGMTFMGAGRMSGVSKKGVAMVMGPSDDNLRDERNYQIMLKDAQLRAQLERDQKTHEAIRNYNQRNGDTITRMSGEMDKYAGAMIINNADTKYSKSMFGLELANIANLSPTQKITNLNAQFKAQMEKIEEQFKGTAIGDDMHGDPLYHYDPKTGSFVIDQARLQKRLLNRKIDPNSEIGQKYQSAVLEATRNHQIEVAKVNFEEAQRKKEESDKRIADQHTAFVNSAVFEQGRYGKDLEVSRLQGSDRMIAIREQSIQSSEQAIEALNKSLSKLDPLSPNYESSKSQILDRVKENQDFIQTQKDLIEAIKRNTAVQGLILARDTEKLQQRIQTGMWKAQDPLSAAIDDFNLDFEKNHVGYTETDYKNLAVKYGIDTSELSNDQIKQAVKNKEMSANLKKFDRARFGSLGLESAQGLAGAFMNGGNKVTAILSPFQKSWNERMQNTVAEFYKGKNAFRDSNGKFSRGAMLNAGAELASSMIMPAIFGENTYASEGSQVGGMIGSFFGPSGGMIGSFAGGLLGGIFGHKHRVDPQDEAYRKRITELLSRIDKSLRPVGDYYRTKVNEHYADSAYLSGRSLGYADMIGAH